MRKTLYRDLEEKEIIRSCSGLRGRILDLGSGNSGYYRLFDPSASVVRTDIDPSRGADVIFDANGKFPLKGGEFDYVFCMNLLEHLDRPDVCISESCRVLEKGGKMFIGVPFAYQYHAQGSSKDTFRYTHSKLEEMLREAGFKTVSVKRLGGRYSLALECVALGMPSLIAGCLRTLGVLTSRMDERLLTTTEKKSGKAFYFALFAEAQK